MIKTHAHPATPWQLKAASEGKLEAIALPLLPEPRKTNNTWFWDGFKPEDLGIFWYEHEKVGNRLLKRLPYRAGNLLYLAEEWHENDDGFVCLSQWLKTAEKVDNSIWQPAETMPIYAAQYWFEITDVRIIKMEAVTEIETEKILGMPLYSSGSTGYGIFRDNWNQTYPEYRWNGDRWVIFLSVSSVDAPSHDTDHIV